MSRGDKEAADLSPTWSVLSETLKEWKREQDKREQEVERESERKIEVNGEQQKREVQLENMPFA